ncbi:MAG: hypothetical protein PQJ60_06640 [Spirochaetales bacterium]|nr:hypothetical protein [Spirochaetales bacterium]
MQIFGTEKGQAHVDRIGSLLKGTAAKAKKEKVTETMEKHYRVLKIKDDKGEWTSPRLADHEKDLLPPRMDAEKLALFVDEMARITKGNSYLMDFMDTLEEGQFPFLAEKFAEEGEEVLFDALCYGAVLQNLTKLCAEDPIILEDVYELFSRKRKELNAFKELPFFHKIKLLSVTKPIESYINCHKTKKISPTSGGFAVKLNITEAVWADRRMGCGDNAFTGRILAKNRCGRKKTDKRTGVGPSGWSEDGKSIERVYPFPADWAALYQVWNMCFVTRFQDFPYVIPKLLIPQVAAYQDKPKNYIYNRAIALFIYLNFASFDYVEKKKTGEKIISWHDRTLSLAFGKVNAASARAYRKKVDQAKKS